MPSDKSVAISGDFTKLSRLMFRRATYLVDRIKADGVLDVSSYMGVREWEEARFVESNRKLAKMPASRDHVGFKFKSKIFARRAHTSVVSLAIGDGLEWVFE